jgi:hypothetical protein
MHKESLVIKHSKLFLFIHLFFFKKRERKKIKAEASTILAPGAISYS